MPPSQEQPHAPAPTVAEEVEEGGEEREDRPLSPDHLFRLWQLEREESLMEARGGWARLDRREFVARVRKEVEDGRSGKMDYLGSWVEFCLP